MDMSRFFVNERDIGDSEIVITDSGDLKHMRKVLRLKPGDEVEVSDSVKWEYRAVIEEISDDSAVLKITDKQAFSREPRIRVTLFQGVPKASKMDEIVQKCTEEGVSEIYPVFMDRTVVVEKGGFGKKIDRWRKVAAEAVKQCRRGRIPEVGEQLSFGQMTDMLSDFDKVIFPYENETGRTIKDALRETVSCENGGCRPERMAVIIGPEGGFSDSEARALKELGADCVSLGKTILRTETAGPAALAMIMYELEL